LSHCLSVSFLLKSIALFSLEITQIQLRRFGEKAKPVGLECSMIDKVGKRIFDPAKIIVGPSQIMRRKPAAIRRISADPLQPIKIPSHYDFLLITGEMASSPFR
jgi:hypothetical protein